MYGWSEDILTEETAWCVFKSRKLICKNTAGIVPNLTNVKACLWKYILTSESKGGTNFLSLSSSGSVHKNLWAQTPGLITRCSALRLEHITAKIEFVSVYLAVLFMEEAGLGITQKRKLHCQWNSEAFVWAFTWLCDFWCEWACANDTALILQRFFFSSVGSTLLNRLALQISVCFNL